MLYSQMKMMITFEQLVCLMLFTVVDLLNMCMSILRVINSKSKAYTKYIVASGCILACFSGWLPVYVPCKLCIDFEVLSLDTLQNLQVFDGKLKA